MFTSTFIAKKPWSWNTGRRKPLEGYIDTHDKRVESENNVNCYIPPDVCEKIHLRSIEAKACLKVTVVDLRGDKNADYDFEVHSIYIDTPKDWRVIITDLSVNKNNETQVFGQIHLSKMNTPAIKCAASFFLNDIDFQLTPKASPQHGICAQAQFNVDNPYPFDIKKLIGGYKKGKASYPLLHMPNIDSFSMGHCDNTCVKFGALILKKPFNLDQGNAFQSHLAKNKMRLSQSSDGDMRLPLTYYLGRNPTKSPNASKLSLNWAHKELVFNRGKFYSQSPDHHSEYEATWFRCAPFHLEYSIANTELMLHGVRHISKNTAIYLTIIDVQELKNETHLKDRKFFADFKNKWRIKEVGLHNDILSKHDYQILKGTVLFDWTPYSVSHDFSEDQWRRLVPDVHTHCFISIPISGLGSIIVQVSPDLLQGHRSLPANTRAQIKLIVNKRVTFQELKKVSTFDFRCGGIDIAVRENATSESTRWKLIIKSASKDTVNNTTKWRVSFYDPSPQSLTVSDFISFADKLSVLDTINPEKKYCIVAATKTNTTLTVKHIESIEL